MAPKLDVAVRDLASAARHLGEITKLLEAVKQNIDDAQIDLLNWHMLACVTGLAGAYGKAQSVMGDATGAAESSGKAIAKSVDSVALHYAGAEYHSQILPVSPRVYRKPHSGSVVTWPNFGIIAPSALGAASGLGYIKGLMEARRTLDIVSKPLGIGSLILAIDSLIVAPNIRVSGPFKDASEIWGAAADNIESARRSLEKVFPVSSWEGVAADAFNDLMTRRWRPALEDLESLARSMRKYCDRLSAFTDKLNGLWLTLTMLTTGLLLPIVFLPPALKEPAAALVAVFYIGLVEGAYRNIKDWFAKVAPAADAVRDRAKTLYDQCFDDAKLLENRRNRLRPHFTMVSDLWTNRDWAKNWHQTANA